MNISAIPHPEKFSAGKLGSVFSRKPMAGSNEGITGLTSGNVLTGAISMAQGHPVT
jgi:hypothetical protein